MATDLAGLPVPALNDAPNGPQAIGLLAAGTGQRLWRAYPCTSGARPTLTTDDAGFLAYETDTGTVIRWSGTAWGSIGSGTSGSGGAGGGTPAAGQWRADTQQSIGTGNTVLAFGVEESPSPYVTRQANGSAHKFVIAETGLYILAASIRMRGGDYGRRYLEWRNAAQTVRFGQVGHYDDDPVTFTVSAPVWLAAGTELVVIASQSGQGSLQTQPSGDDIGPGWVRATIARVGVGGAVSGGGVPDDGSVTDIKVATNAAINADKLTDGTTNKIMTATERTKLAGIAAGATVNDTDANLKNRANHTGTQAISTVTGLQTAIDAKADDSAVVHNALLTTKGDLVAATGSATPARLAVGTNGQVLTADSSAAAGVKWASAGGDSSALNVPLPEDHGIKAWSVDPATCAYPKILTKGKAYFAKIHLRQGETLTGIITYVQTAGATLSNCYGALFDASGTQVAVTANISSSLTSTGEKKLAFTSAYAAAAGVYYVALLIGNGSTTPPMIPVGNDDSQASAWMNLGLTASAGWRFGTSGSSLTAMPASITLGSTSDEQWSWLLAAY